MKGIILAGGTGSRLKPLTKVTNKHLLPVGNRPMICHSIEKLVESNITDIMIITGTEHMGDMIALLGSGRSMGCELTYRVQDTPDGIAGALNLCRNFCKNDSSVVILGDNIFETSLEHAVEQFSKNVQTGKKPQCMLLLKKVDDPERFGVATIEGTKITEIQEKPEVPKSNFCVTGIYFYDKNVFGFIDSLKKSDRGEYEVTDINNMYIYKGDANFSILEGWWTDAGTHKSYQHANTLVHMSENNNEK